uniref:Ankyrin repeat domain 6b n=1 Tax=Tetraodon nigroviridis TaxID=99883 RepID=H3CP72_TETNG
MSQEEEAEVLALSEHLLIASHKGQADNVVQLINKGAKVAVTKYGRSPLHLAAHKGHLEVVHILLKAGCDLDIQDDGDQTAVHRAAMVGNAAVIRALLREGCALERQDKDGNTALHEASWHGFSRSVQLLVKAGANVHAKNKVGHTPLHLACQNGHIQSSKVLLLGGSRPDSRDQLGDSCLHVAARYNHVAVIRILLGAFCSVSHRNLQAGDTPLHVGATLNHKKTVRLLLEAGADTRTRNNAGQTALDQAREHNNPAVALLLTKAPQIQSVLRGRSVRKRREKLKAEGRTQSLPRDGSLPCKDSVSTQSSDGAPCRHEERTGPNAGGGKGAERKFNPSFSDPLRRKEMKQTEVSPRRKPGPRASACPPPIPPHSWKAYQLFTLYRSQDGRIMQAPLRGCRCEPLVRKLENQLQATKEEMKTEVHAVQDLINRRVGQQELRSRQQVRVLDKMAVERMSAERSQCLRSIEQRTLQERLETERSQASLVGELKRWCLSQLQNLELRLSGDPSGTELRAPPSATDAEGQGVEEASPATASNRPPSAQAVRPKALPAARADGRRRSPSLQDWDLESRQRQRGAPSPSERHRGKASCRGRDRQPGSCRNRQHRKPAEGRKAGLPEEQPSGGHALEVTQHFLEAVSTQLERWYEGKVEEARSEAYQRTQAERGALLERIAHLEEELRLLRKSRTDLP